MNPFAEVIMAHREEIEARQRTEEITLKAMFCMVTADLIIFQAAVAALRLEGILTTKMVDRIAINAQQRLQEMKSAGLSPPLANEIRSQLDDLSEQLHRNRSSPLVEPSQVVNGAGVANGNAKRRIR